MNLITNNRRLVIQQAARKSSHSFFNKKEVEKLLEKIHWFKNNSISITTLNLLRNLVTIILVLLILITLFKWLLNPNTFPITSVTIEGNTTITTDTIRSILAPYLTGGFFHIDQAAIQTALNNLAWINTVKVQKYWPHHLSIHITENHPVALWQENLLVDDQGKLENKPISLQVTQLPLFTGQSKSVHEILTHYNMLKPILQTAQLSVREFGYDTHKAWYMILNDGTQLLLGRGDNRHYLQRFAKVYPRIVAQLPPHLQQNQNCVRKTKAQMAQDCQINNNKRAIVQVDLRYTNGVAVRLTAE